MYSKIIVFTILYSITTSLSIAILGDRGLIGGDILNMKSIFKIIFNYKFVGSMTLAVLSRFLFVLLNNAILDIPKLAQNATTITVFVSFISTIFMVLANYFLLDERLNMIQIIGMTIILIGVFLMLK